MEEVKKSTGGFLVQMMMIMMMMMMMMMMMITPVVFSPETRSCTSELIKVQGKFIFDI